MRMRFSAAIVGADLSVYAYVIQLFPHCIFPVSVFSFLSFFRFILPFAPLASYVTLQAFISLQGKLIAWEKPEKKMWLETLPDWPAWLSIYIWIGERQLAMSEEEEALWETSARHLRFRCFSHIFNTFHRRSAGLFQAGISDSRKWASAFWSRISVPQSVSSFRPARPSSGSEKAFSFHVGWRK